VTSVVLFMVTGSAYVLLFALMGPVMAGASFLDSRRTAKQQEHSQELKKEEQRTSEAETTREQRDLHRRELLRPELWVADAFGWSQEFSLLKQLSEYATVIIDGYTSSQLRSLQLTSQSLPYTSQDSVVLISPEGEISRATL
jgi:hypothetical protein